MLPDAAAAVFTCDTIVNKQAKRRSKHQFSIQYQKYFSNYFNVKCKGKRSTAQRWSLLSVCSEVTTEDRETPEPISPDDVEVEVNYEPDPTDLVLSSVPGGELFDPRKHKFTEDELKPQPMIKKAKKVFVPEEQKVCDCKSYISISFP